jgi:hypothetical protein
MAPPEPMLERLRKRGTVPPVAARRRPEPDVNELAFVAVQRATGRAEPAVPPEPEKNPAAVALGKLGGAKGGKARAASLSPKRRSAIARKAARARWAKP